MDPDQAIPTPRRGVALRASEADRERTADLLRDHHLAGRLDADEFRERLESCLSAKTLAELRTLFVDLPQLSAARERHVYEGVGSRAVPRVALVAVLVAALIVASALTNRPLFFPAVPIMLFALRPLWWHWWGRGAHIASEHNTHLSS